MSWNRFLALGKGVFGHLVTIRICFQMIKNSSVHLMFQMRCQMNSKKKVWMIPNVGFFTLHFASFRHKTTPVKFSILTGYHLDESIGSEAKDVNFVGKVFFFFFFSNSPCTVLSLDGWQACWITGSFWITRSKGKSSLRQVGDNPEIMRAEWEVGDKWQVRHHGDRRVFLKFHTKSDLVAEKGGSEDSEKKKQKTHFFERNKPLLIHIQQKWFVFQAVILKSKAKDLYLIQIQRKWLVFQIPDLNFLIVCRIFDDSQNPWFVLDLIQIQHKMISFQAVPEIHVHPKIL